MRIFLLNDNANIGHVGCQAVSDGTARLLGHAGHTVVRRSFLGAHGAFRNPDAREGVAAVLRDPGLTAALAACDAVVVNGEGTIHHGAGTELLCILGAAASLGLPAVLANAVIEEVHGFDDILRRLTDLTVRDGKSLAWLHARGIPARLVPDTFLAARFDDVPAFDTGGRVVVTDWHHARDDDSGRTSLRLFAALGARERWFLPFLCRDAAECWARIPATLRGARGILTGRHHAVYCALLAGVPFVALPSNTWKIEGTAALCPELAEYLCPDDPAAALARAMDRREDFAAASEALRARPQLDTFAAMGDGILPGGEPGATREVARLAADLAQESALRQAPDLAYRLRRRSDEIGLALRHGLS